VASGPTIWNVTAGDTCSGIAAAVGVSLAALLSVNPGINANLIHPGQVLHLPAGSRWPAGHTPTPAPAHPTAGPTIWIVDPGDTMTSIAARSGVSLAALEAVNRGINYNLLHPGQRLNLPAGAHW
jgi:LysM repeat protein